MKEIFENLAEEAMVHVPGQTGLHTRAFSLEKFAELIVLECLEIVASSDPDRNKPKQRPTTKILGEPYNKIFNRIEEHFGIE